MKVRFKVMTKEMVIAIKCLGACSIEPWKCGIDWLWLVIVGEKIFEVGQILAITLEGKEEFVNI